MSLQDYIDKKFVQTPKDQVELKFDNFLEQMGYAIYSLDFKKNHVFVENFLLNKDLKNISAEEEINYLNKLRYKKLLDDKDILNLKENFSIYCKNQSEKARLYLEFLLKNYSSIDAKIQLVFNEKIFPEYELLIEIHDKKNIYSCTTSYKLDEIKNAFDNFLDQFGYERNYKNNCVFYGFVSKENKMILEDYIKKISWNLPIEIPTCVTLVNSLDDCKPNEQEVFEVKASIDDVFLCGKDIHIINENFIPKRIRWIKI